MIISIEKNITLATVSTKQNKSNERPRNDSLRYNIIFTDKVNVYRKCGVHVRVSL